MNPLLNLLDEQYDLRIMQAGVSRLKKMEKEHKKEMFITNGYIDAAELTVGNPFESISYEALLKRITKGDKPND